MGSSASNEQESNASSTRLQSGPSGRGLNEDLDRVERETEKEHAEEERVANSQPIAITATDPPPGVTVEIGEAETVLAFLKKVALLLGLDESDAPSLQMQFSEAILAHELELKAAGLCDASLCSVLGVEERLEAKAEAKAVNIITAVTENRLADVQLVCQYASEKLNDKDEVLFLVVTHLLLNLFVCLWDRVGTLLFTRLHRRIRWRLLSCLSKPKQT